MIGSPREWRLEARTDLWTGDAYGRGERTIPTGLLGSIRWWCEVLARGLGGAACDPSDEANRCPQHDGWCVICELFGCTGWARKFRFEVRDLSGAVKSGAVKRAQITQDNMPSSSADRFVLRLTPLREIRDEEWALLDLTLRLIAGYGAMGGKTVLKPSDEARRAGLPHHHDHGIVEVEGRPDMVFGPRPKLEGYVRDQRWRQPPQTGFTWASLTNFWCVDGKYLARQNQDKSTFNIVLGRKEPKHLAQQLARDRRLEQWLAGGQGKSKRVFSFKSPPRTFGFVNPPEVTFNQMQERLEQVWAALEANAFMTGDMILTGLFAGGAG